jgi:hypothetical protein
VLAFVLISPVIGFAGETSKSAPPTDTVVSSDNSPVVPERTKEASPPTASKPLPAPVTPPIQSELRANGSPSTLEILQLFGTVVLGFLASLLYLLTKFRQWWGLKIVGNGWSVLFLVGGTISSMLVTGSVHSIGWMQSVAPIAGWGPLISGSLLGTPFFSFLGKLGRSSKAKSDNQPKGINELAGTGFFVDMIVNNISRQINLKIDQLARQLDWPEIIDCTERAFSNQKMVGRITEEEHKKARDFIAAFSPEVDQKTDLRHKYEALGRAVEKLPFSVLYEFCQNRDKPA